jgi:hypothetical protein
MWWRVVDNASITLSFIRKKVSVSHSNPAKVSANRTDTTGLENIFDVTVSDETADTSKPDTIEVSISEAAQRLGTSERTIWRRIDRGELKSRTRGNKRIVKIPIYTPSTVMDSDSHVTLHDTPQTANALIDLRVLLKELQGANYRIGFLEAQLDTHKEQVKLLPDLQTKAIEAELMRQRLAETEKELQNLKQSWWYKIWSKLSHT